MIVQASQLRKQDWREHTRARNPLPVGKIPNGVCLENLLRRWTASAALPDIVPGAGEGI
jgi:hypothetical protein